MPTTIWPVMMMIPGRANFVASGNFDSVDCQIAGLGEIPAIQDIYVAHTAAAIK